MGSTSMPTDDEVMSQFPGIFTQYKDGRVDRWLGTEIVAPCTDPQTGVESKDVAINQETGLSARLYMPLKTADNDQKKHCLIIYYHGGAFVCQTPFSPTYQPFINAIVSQTDAVCVSVHYRRAPEHLLPVPYDDSWVALKWALSQNSEPWLSPDKVDFDRVFLVGDSAGGNIAQRMAIQIGSEGVFVNGREELVKKVEGLVLIHPFFWRNDPVDENDIIDPTFKRLTEEFWALICPSTPETDNPWLNPVTDPEFSSLGSKRVSVFTTENDYYKAEAWQYYKTLIKSEWGGVAEIEETPGEEHVFHLTKPESDKSLDVIKRVISFVSRLHN